VSSNARPKTSTSGTGPCGRVRLGKDKKKKNVKKTSNDADEQTRETRTAPVTAVRIKNASFAVRVLTSCVLRRARAKVPTSPDLETWTPWVARLRLGYVHIRRE